MVKFNKVTDAFAKKMTALLSEDAVHSHAEKLEKHARDFSPDLYFLPEVVVIPSSTEDVSGIMAFAMNTAFRLRYRVREVV